MEGVKIDDYHVEAALAVRVGKNGEKNAIARSYPFRFRSLDFSFDVRVERHI